MTSSPEPKIPEVSGGLQLPVVSPHQDPYRTHQSQALLRQLQLVLLSGEAPNSELLSETLKKAELLATTAADQPHLDADTRKTLEDISSLLVTARQLGRNKLMDERLAKLYDESQKVLNSTRGDMFSSNIIKEANQSVLEFVDTWRPLFYLLMSSREFRQLLLEIMRIIRNVMYSFEEPSLEKITAADGVPSKEITQTVKTEMERKEIRELSDEEWGTIQDDVQRVLVILAKCAEYRQGIESLFSLLDMFKKSLGRSATSSVVEENIHVRRLVTETEDLVACFSGRETLEEFKFHLRNLIEKVRKDENMKLYMNELKDFILKTRSEEEIRSEKFRTDSKELANRGRQLSKKFNNDDDLKPFLKVTNDMIDNIKNDEFLQILRHHAGIVQSDISYVDSDGKVQVDSNMLNKLQSALVPLLVEALKYIPVPCIHSSDPNREFWLDNIVLCSYDLFPDNIRFHLETDSNLALRDIDIKGTQTFLVIELNHLLTELKDVEFYYRMKSFPSIEEKGRATFRIKGDGAKLTFTYKLVQEPADVAPRVKEGYASFHISDMEIDFDTDTLNYPILVPPLTKLFKAEIRQQIEKQVEKNLSGFIVGLSEMMTDSLSQYNRTILSGIESAKKTVKSSTGKESPKEAVKSTTKIESPQKTVKSLSGTESVCKTSHMPQAYKRIILE
jgi:hypothetical protein